MSSVEFLTVSWSVGVYDDFRLFLSRPRVWMTQYSPLSPYNNLMSENILNRSDFVIVLSYLFGGN
jgi:hypothetical protein